MVTGSLSMTIASLARRVEGLRLAAWLSGP